MKKIKVLFMMSAMAFAGVTTFNACTDPCKDVTCVNGECTEGDCVCDAGYEGTDCGTEQRAEFLSAYSVSEACNSGNYSYNITVSTSSSSVNAIVISNFGDYGVTVTGTVSDNALTIASQQVTISGTAATFSGSGQISGNILTITYTISAGTDSDTCTMTCTKQ